MTRRPMRSSACARSRCRTTSTCTDTGCAVRGTDFRRFIAGRPSGRRPAAPDPDALEDLAARVRYGGNPEHKRNPGDFGLTPPARPRADKSKCDWAGIVERAVALRLLREGIRRGLVSEQRRGGYPQNVWALTNDGYPLEAQLENSVSGAYHGYPMPETDPFRDVVLEHWTTI